MAAGCAPSPAPPELAQRFLDALNAHDADRVVALLAADATYEEPGRSTRLAPAAYREHLAQQWAVWRDQVYSPRRVVGVGDELVIEWVLHQTHQQRDAVTMEGVFVLEASGGRIARVRNYFDGTPLLRFLKPKSG